MGFDETQDYIDSSIEKLMRLLQHPVCFAYSRGGANVDFESAFLALRDEIQESFGLDSLVIVHSGSGRTSMSAAPDLRAEHVRGQPCHLALADERSTRSSREVASPRVVRSGECD